MSTNRDTKNSRENVQYKSQVMNSQFACTYKYAVMLT